MNVDPNQPVSWMAVPEDVPVLSSDGATVGTLHDVLGSKEEDIFHGIVIKLADRGRPVFVSSDDVSLLTPSHVQVGLTRDKITALPTYSEEPTFSLGWKGIFGKHIDWIEDKDR